MLDELLEDVATLIESDDPLGAELAGATVLAALSDSGDELVPLFVQEFIPQVESRPNPSALALLLVIGSTASGTHDQIAKAASAATDRLAAAGIPQPRWAAELAEPLRPGEHMRLQDPAESVSVLVGSFQRAGRGHAFLVTVDHDECGAASDIFLVTADVLPEVLDDLRTDGLVVTTPAIDPAEFRWYVEDALDAEAVHDCVPFEEQTSIRFEDAPLEVEDDDEQGPPYPVVAALLRTRLAALPPARKPAGARAHHEEGAAHPAPLLEELTYLTTAIPDSRGANLVGGPLKLPPKRKKADGPAPIYQIKVGLVGTKPPIWRRLLVPADVSLSKLHDIVQAAFDWDGSHLHVFWTPYGDFGREDRELGHRSAKPVTLEQVTPRAGAPGAKDKIRYTYDFGDDWAHDIVVEKVLDPDPELTYPRCVGGRRAAPPDDCGGIWGYEHLVEVIANPRHPDHEERLDWLGLDNANDFDPAAFDPEEVNRALAKLR